MNCHSFPTSGFWRLKLASGLLATLLLYLFVQQVKAAPPQMTYLYPAGGQRGQSVKTAVGGSQDAWPVKVWCDTPGVAVECAAEKGQLNVSLAPDAIPGTALFRLYNEQGATGLRPFVIGHLPEVMEQEPNDDPRKPQRISDKATTMNGQLASRGDVDSFAVSLNKGQTLVASLVANERLGSPVDAVVQIVSEAGFVLAQNDDERGMDPQIAYVAPRDGTYLVRTFGFPAVADSSINFAGNATFVYRLTISAGAPWVDYSLPMAAGNQSSLAPVDLVGWNLPDDLRSLAPLLSPNADRAIVFDPRLANSLSVPATRFAVQLEQRDKPADKQRIELPAVVTGRIGAAGEIDSYVFAGKKGESIDCQIESRQLGFPLDPVLTALDAAGKQLGRADDDGNASRDARLPILPAEDGDIEVRVADLHRQGGPRYVYRLTLSAAQPDFRLTAPATEFAVEVGKPLEIALTVNRLGGFAEPIEISALNLPEGVTAEKVVSQPSDAEAPSGNRRSGGRRGSRGPAGQSAKLILKAEKAGVHGRLRIVGQASGESKLERTAEADLKDYGMKTAEFWLTVPPAK